MISEKTKSNRKFLIIFIFAFIFAFIAILIVFYFYNTTKVKEAKFTELGNPSGTIYSRVRSARSVWDMIAYDNKIYIGSGDFIENAGPVNVWRYDITTEQWENSGLLPDEEVNRFLIIDGVLTIPGTDPRDDWTLGNYYVLRDDQWVINQTIPKGIHNFDLIEFEGKLFAGIGAQTGSYPILSSEDGGTNFSQVLMEKDNKPIDTSNGECIQTQEFFIQNDTLYATFYYLNSVSNELEYDIYKYENEKFVFDNEWYSKIAQIKNWNMIIGAKSTFNDRLFFTTGYLYATDDMNYITRIQFPKEEIVWDIIVANNELYVLTGVEQNDGTFLISVWQNKSGKLTDFTKMLNFRYEIPAMSFSYLDGMFYFGMASINSISEKNGMILRVDYEK